MFSTYHRILFLSYKLSDWNTPTICSRSGPSVKFYYPLWCSSQKVGPIYSASMFIFSFKQPFPFHSQAKWKAADKTQWRELGLEAAAWPVISAALVCTASWAPTAAGDLSNYRLSRGTPQAKSWVSWAAVSAAAKWELLRSSWWRQSNTHGVCLRHFLLPSPSSNMH